MAGPTDQLPSEETGATAVPDLIERYRLRRDAWIAQADELARLRDEVRGSAEREAMEIVTAARRDVRRVITEARRELLVLSAQVQAALGEVNAKTDPAALLNKAGIPVAEGEEGQLSLTDGSADVTFAPETAVDEILNEVHDDITALVEDARALPLQAVTASSTMILPEPPVSASLPPAPVSIPAPAPPPAPAKAITPTPVASPPPASRPYFDPSPAALSESASKALLSSQFPSEAVPVPSGRRLGAFVGLFVGAGIIAVLGTLWWMRSPGTAQPVATVADGASRTPAAPAVAPAPAEKTEGGKTESAAPAARGNLSLVAEAVRDVWVRTTIDGRTDQGRTLAAGQVIDVSAEQSVFLRVGDAGAIVVSVNHGEKRPLGRDGQVITREFVAEGTSTPESAPPAPATPPAPTAPAPAPPARGPSGPPTASATPPSPAPPMPSPAAASAPASTAVPVAPTPAASANVPPPAPAPTRSEAAPAAPATSTSPATAVVAAARQWLDAYHRQDRAAMAALSTDNMLLADERRTDERFPPGLDDVTRTLDRVSVQIAADTAVLTAVMTEQSTSSTPPRVSPVSQVWVLAGGGQWKVRQARFVSEARLNQVFR